MSRIDKINDEYIAFTYALENLDSMTCEDIKNLISNIEINDASINQDFIDFSFAMESEMNTEDTTDTKQNEVKAEKSGDLAGSEDAKSNTVDPNNADAKSAEEKGREIGETTNKLFMMLNEMIQNFLTKFSNNLKLLIQTDKGFIKEFTEAEKNYKPSSGQEIIVYDYKSRRIDNVRRLFNGIIKESVNTFMNATPGSQLDPDSIFEANDQAFDQILLRQLHAPSGVNTTHQWFTALRADFRGKKITTIVRPDMIPEYRSIALDSGKRLQGLLNADKNEAYNLINRMVSMLKKVRNDKTLTDEQRARATKYAKKLVRLEKIFNSYLDFYYSMKIEHILSCREVLKRMYHLK